MTLSSNSGRFRNKEIIFIYHTYIFAKRTCWIRCMVSLYANSSIVLELWRVEVVRTNIPMEVSSITFPSRVPLPDNSSDALWDECYRLSIFSPQEGGLIIWPPSVRPYVRTYVRPWTAISQKCMGQLVWNFRPRTGMVWGLFLEQHQLDFFQTWCRENSQHVCPFIFCSI